MGYFVAGFFATLTVLVVVDTALKKIFIVIGGEIMILGLISSIAATESVAMLIEGSALAITTFYAAKKGKSVRRK